MSRYAILIQPGAHRTRVGRDTLTTKSSQISGSFLLFCLFHVRQTPSAALEHRKWHGLEVCAAAGSVHCLCSRRRSSSTAVGRVIVMCFNKQLVWQHFPAEHWLARWRRSFGSVSCHQQKGVSESFGRTTRRTCPRRSSTG